MLQSLYQSFTDLLMEKSRRFLLTEDCNIKREIVLFIFLLVIANIVTFLISLIKKTNVIRRIKNWGFKILLKVAKMEDEIAFLKKDSAEEIQNSKKTTMSIERTLRIEPATAEQIEQKLKEATVHDFELEKTQRVSGNYYTKLNSEIKKYVKKNAADFMYTNILHFEESKGSLHLETELISWMLDLFNGKKGSVGSSTTGGTESIILAVYTYREYAKKYYGIQNPEIIVPSSIHIAFHKGCSYMGVTLRELPVDEDTGLCSLDQYKKAINSNTIMIAQSAINFPHGVHDDVYKLNEYLVSKNSRVMIHIDGCLGGYMTSASARLEDNRFGVMDFRLSNVGSISCDPHKYGRAPKGCSVLLYANEKIKEQSVYVGKSWTGGVYITPTLIGSRSAVGVVGAWISMQMVGIKGLDQIYRDITSCCDFLVREISKFDKLQIIGDPKASAISFKWRDTKSPKQIFVLSNQLKERKFGLPTIQKPFGLRVSITKNNYLELQKNLIPAIRDSLDFMDKNQDLKGDKFSVNIYGSLLTTPNGDFVDEFLQMIQCQINKFQED